MKKLNIEIELENDAFRGGYRNKEVESCLKNLLYRLKQGYSEGTILDHNGNKVGSFKISNDKN